MSGDTEFVAIYCGPCTLKGGAKGHAFIREDTEDDLAFGGRFTGVVGGRYGWTLTDAGKYRQGDYIGMSTDERLPVWRAEADVALTRQRTVAAERAAKALSKGALGDLTLDQCRQLLRGRSGANRHAAVAVILAYMEGW